MDNVNVNGMQIGGQVVNQPAQQYQNTGVNTQPQGNMFTQEQLNAIIGTRVSSLNNKIQDLTNQLAAAQQLANNYASQVTNYQQRDTVVNSGVPAQFVDYVRYEASKLAVNGKSFEDAVKEFTKSNEALFSSQPTSTQGNVNPTQMNIPTTAGATQQPSSNANAQTPSQGVSQPAPMQQTVPMMQQIAPQLQGNNPVATGNTGIPYPNIQQSQPAPAMQMQFGGQPSATVGTQIGSVGSTSMPGVSVVTGNTSLEDAVTKFLNEKHGVKA